MKKQNKNTLHFFSRKLGKDGDIIVKRFTQPNLVLATGAGTSIPITIATSDQVRSAPASEWASFAARYQEYRVRALRILAKAVNPVQTATISHSSLYMGDYLGSSTPSSVAAVLSDENCIVKDTCHDFILMTDWRRNPNAKLWSSTNGTGIPAANQFSVVVCSSSTPALTTATTYYAYAVEWEVELRGSQ
jgi:hypothetical protein